MIVADVLGPWWDIEATDEAGTPYRDRQRLPQFVHDIGDDMAWRDVTAQVSDAIPPTPGLGVWRVWATAAQVEELVRNAAYEVLRSAEVAGQHVDAPDWPVLAAPVARQTASDAFPPLPESGWLEAGALYQYGDGVVIVRQSHNRTEHDPADVPALFMVYRADSEDVLAWIAGEQVQVGTQRVYDGVTYECLQAHVTQSDWAPPAVPALWRVVVEEPTTAEWAVGVAYKVGDIVTYLGREYSCRQAHTSILSWNPAAVLALWLPL